VFSTLAFSYFFVYFHRVSSAVVSADLQTTFQVSTAVSIALLSSVYFYAYTVMQLPSGLLTDNWEPLKTVRLFTFIAAAGAILTGMASTIETVIIGRLLIGIGVAMVYIPTMKIPMGRALKMTFGAGMKFWLLAIWFFFMYGSMMVYQGLWAGPFFHDIVGWDRPTYGLVLTFIGIGMIMGCPTAGYISDKILKSRKKVLIIGTAVYTIIWAIIWITAGHISSTGAYMAINFAFGFFGGFFVVSYAQIKELFPISIVGTSTAALNVFPFAGGAILQQVSGLMLATRSLESYQGLWFFMLIFMIIASAAALLSKEKEPDNG
jgi:MFS family permease